MSYGAQPEQSLEAMGYKAVSPSAMFSSIEKLCSCFLNSLFLSTDILNLWVAQLVEYLTHDLEVGGKAGNTLMHQ